MYINANKLNSINVDDGLAGIGLGIDFLIKKGFVQGNINRILEDIDDVIFKKITIPNRQIDLSTLDLIQLIYYLSVRLEKQKSNSDNQYLFRGLIIFLVNFLSEKIDPTFFEEPPYYMFNYQLPQLLFVLNKIYSLNFYNERLLNILEGLSIRILSIIPALHANKLYLFQAMQSVKHITNSKKWDSHVKLLYNELNFNTIIDSEFKNKNIFFSDGLLGIYVLLSFQTEFFSVAEIAEFKRKIFLKIKDSEAWQKLLYEPSYFEYHKGLYDGYAGIVLFGKITDKIFI